MCWGRACGRGEDVCCVNNIAVPMMCFYLMEIGQHDMGVRRRDAGGVSNLDSNSVCV